jgi:PilZ domain-containing protein
VPWRPKELTSIYPTRCWEGKVIAVGGRRGQDGPAPADAHKESGGTLSHQQSTIVTGIRRPRRFQIRMQFRFRPSGEIDWRTGMLENISSSGLQFWAETPVAVHTPLEMEFELPVGIRGWPAALVVCRGEVVRTVPPASKDELPAVSARIFDYRGKMRNLLRTWFKLDGLSASSRPTARSSKGHFQLRQLPRSLRQRRGV